MVWYTGCAMNRDFVFIDLETTGLSPYYERVIEVGMLRVSNGRVVDTINTLIDPGQQIKYYITKITGIKNADLQGQPQFEDVVQKMEKFMEGSVVIAHNARFDYSFLKAEFERLEKSFLYPMGCSMLLSRRLYPQFRKHNLDSLIDRFGFKVENRHRALDDAKLIHDFFDVIKAEHEDEKFESAFNASMVN